MPNIQDFLNGAPKEKPEVKKSYKKQLDDSEQEELKDRFAYLLREEERKSAIRKSSVPR